jgi:hypothetical protein
MAVQPDDELVKDVFAHFGLAAYLAQVLERSLVSALTTVYGPEETRLTREQLDERFEDLSRKGLGSLAGILRQAGLSAEVVGAVQDALEDRSRLLHRFFWDHAVDISSPEGCRRMLDELAQFQQRFVECNSLVLAEVHRWAASHGITTGDFDAVEAAMLERGRALSEAEIDDVVGPARRGNPRP